MREEIMIDDLRYNGKLIKDLSKKTLIKILTGLWLENIRMKEYIDGRNMSLIVKPNQKEINKILSVS